MASLTAPRTCKPNTQIRQYLSASPAPSHDTSSLTARLKNRASRNDSPGSISKVQDPAIAFGHRSHAHFQLDGMA
jgi:hypothetical protein